MKSVGIVGYVVLWSVYIRLWIINGCDGKMSVLFYFSLSLIWDHKILLSLILMSVFDHFSLFSLHETFHGVIRFSGVLLLLDLVKGSPRKVITYVTAASVC